MGIVCPCRSISCSVLQTVSSSDFRGNTPAATTPRVLCLSFQSAQQEWGREWVWVLVIVVIGGCEPGAVGIEVVEVWSCWGLKLLRLRLRLRLLWLLLLLPLPRASRATGRLVRLLRAFKTSQSILLRFLHPGARVQQERTVSALVAFAAHSSAFCVFFPSGLMVLINWGGWANCTGTCGCWGDCARVCSCCGIGLRFRCYYCGGGGWSGFGLQSLFQVFGEFLTLLAASAIGTLSIVNVLKRSEGGLGMLVLKSLDLLGFAQIGSWRWSHSLIRNFWNSNFFLSGISGLGRIDGGRYRSLLLWNPVLTWSYFGADHFSKNWALLHLAQLGWLSRCDSWVLGYADVEQQRKWWRGHAPASANSNILEDPGLPCTIGQYWQQKEQ